mgnify:CR=1 FL=1
MQRKEKNMKNILIINGPNLNMLGIREPNIYGNITYKDLCKKLKKYAKEKSIKLEIFQSNEEGKIVTKIQKSINKNGIIINAGAYTHTSIAILDALKAIKQDNVIEVHISNIEQREEFRKKSYISLVAKKSIIGKGIQGYFEALDNI